MPAKKKSARKSSKSQALKSKSKRKPDPRETDPAFQPVDASKIDMGNSYSLPPRYYSDIEFTCRDCGARQVWTAAQQKWWYEEAGGYFFATAVRCRPCRQRERDRKAEARRIQEAGEAKKREQKRKAQM